MKCSLMRQKETFITLKVSKAQSNMKGNLKLIEANCRVRGGERDNRRKGPSNKVQIACSLEELYNGAKQSFDIKRNVYCSKCKGSGAEGGETKTCPTCRGKGVTM